MRYVIVLLILAVSGCATPEQIAARQQAEAQEYQRQVEAYRYQLSASCTSFGFQAGTPQHSNCMLSLHQQNQANTATIRAALGAAAIQSQPRPTRPCRSLPPGLAGYAAAQGNCY